jgi:hypothetical protein
MTKRLSRIAATLILSVLALTALTAPASAQSSTYTQTFDCTSDRYASAGIWITGSTTATIQNIYSNGILVGRVVVSTGNDTYTVSGPQIGIRIENLSTVSSIYGSNRVEINVSYDEAYGVGIGDLWVEYHRQRHSFWCSYPI